MKKLLVFLIVFVISISISGSILHSKDSMKFKDMKTEDEGAYVPDELVIGYAEGIDMEEPAKKVREKHNLTLEEKGYNSNFEVVKVPKDKKLDDLIQDITKEKDVEYVELNYIATALADPIIPDDSLFHPYQWNFYEYGRTSNGYASNYGIQATLAWNLSTGSGVKIAIIDTGIAYENYGSYTQAPDLAGVGFDTNNAFDFINNDSHANDDEGHGTHVCGTIAQATQNNLGCAGIAYNATILPIKVLDANGSGSYTAIANGIRWAADKGAKVINMSLGGSGKSTTLQNAVKYAYGKGLVIVCAAGNSGSSSIIYPARYVECIAVGATRFDGAKAYYSNYGKDLDIVAPGGDVRVDQNGDGYGDGILQQTFDTTGYSYFFYQGTSMATPHVAAVAALVLSKNSSYSNVQVRSAIQSTALDLGKRGFDTSFGYGLVNAYAAVNWTP